MNPVLRWVAGFAFTQIVEVPIYVRALGSRSRAAKAIAIAFGASAITHPIVWLVFPRIVRPVGGTTLVAAETFAVVVEALYLSFFSVPRSLVWSLIANVASFALGTLSHHVWGLP